MVTHDEIISRAWRLERGRGGIRSSFVTFLENGRLEGYSHPNEAVWTIQDGVLSFRNNDGVITSFSKTIERGGKGELIISMVQSDRPSDVAHILTDIGLIAKARRIRRTIVWEGIDHFAFKVTPEVESLFGKYRVFSSHAGDPRWQEGDVIRASKNYSLQKYIGVYAGDEIPDIGSFSYSFSRTDMIKVIGRYCSIAGDVSVMGTTHPYQFITSSEVTYQRATRFIDCFRDFGAGDWSFLENPNKKDLPSIGNDVWIGARVMLAQGIHIGDGAVIGAGSVVTKDVPPYAIVGGVPARIIKYRFSEKICEQLYNLKWWRFAFPHFCNLRVDDPENFIRNLEAQITDDKIDVWEPQTEKLIDLITDYA